MSAEAEKWPSVHMRRVARGAWANGLSSPVPYRGSTAPDRAAATGMSTTSGSREIVNDTLKGPAGLPPAFTPGPGAGKDELSPDGFLTAYDYSRAPMCKVRCPVRMNAGSPIRSWRQTGPKCPDEGALTQRLHAQRPVASLGRRAGAVEPLDGVPVVAHPVGSGAHPCPAPARRRRTEGRTLRRVGQGDRSEFASGGRGS